MMEKFYKFYLSSNVSYRLCTKICKLCKVCKICKVFKLIKVSFKIKFSTKCQSIWLQLVEILDIVHCTYCKSSDK